MSQQPQPVVSKAYVTIVVSRIEHWLQCEDMDNCELCKEDMELRLPIASEEESVLASEVKRLRSIAKQQREELEELRDDHKALKDQFDGAGVELKETQSKLLNTSQQLLKTQTQLKDAKAQQMPYGYSAHPGGIKALEEFLYYHEGAIKELAGSELQHMLDNFHGQPLTPDFVHGSLLNEMAKLLAVFPLIAVKKLAYSSLNTKYYGHDYGYGDKQYYQEHYIDPPWSKKKLSPFEDSEVPMFAEKAKTMLKEKALKKKAPPIEEFVKKAQVAIEDELSKKKWEAPVDPASVEEKMKTKAANFGFSFPDANTNKGLDIVPLVHDADYSYFEKKVADYLSNAGTVPITAESAPATWVQVQEQMAKMKEAAKAIGVPVQTATQNKDAHTLTVDKLKDEAEKAFPEPPIDE